MEPVVSESKAEAPEETPKEEHLSLVHGKVADSVVGEKHHYMVGS